MHNLVVVDFLRAGMGMNDGDCLGRLIRCAVKNSRDDVVVVILCILQLLNDGRSDTISPAAAICVLVPNLALTCPGQKVPFPNIE